MAKLKSARTVEDATYDELVSICNDHECENCPISELGKCKELLFPCLTNKDRFFEGLTEEERNIEIEN